MTDDHDSEGELERLMRAGLERRAGEADTTAPVAQLAMVAARRRRGGRIAAGVAAVAVAAVAAVAVTGFVVDRSASPGGDGAPGVADDPSGEVIPDAWRTEYWHDVKVDVPADWGWGTAPVSPVSSADRYLCGGPGAMVTGAGKRLVNANPSLPYVGRPIMLSDACVAGAEEDPQAPYVWFDGGLEPGTVDVGNGYTQETVTVAGGTVTVATDDAALRQRILDSATAGETCPSNLEQAPTVDSMLTEGMGTVSSALVCVYRSDSGNGFDLAYATTLSAEDARAYSDAMWNTPQASDPGHCSGSTEYVVITLTGDDPYGTEPVTQDSVIAPGCELIERTPGDYAKLTKEATLPWSDNGLQAVLFYFIGMLG